MRASRLVLVTTLTFMLIATLLHADPVNSGLASLARPEENVTGWTHPGWSCA